MEKLCVITILPLNKSLEAYQGDSLYTVLLVAGLLDPDNPTSDRLRLEKGAVSEAEHPEAEAAVFTPAELAEGWFLASERRVIDDAVLTLAETVSEDSRKAVPLDTGYGMAVDMGTATIAAGLINLENMRIPLLTNIRNSQTDIALEIDDRIAYCRDNARNTLRMQNLLRQDINRAAQKLCNKAGIKGKLINALVLVGNYPLIAIMLGELPPRNWPSFGEIIQKPSAELGLKALNREATVYILPAASPQFGADTTAAVLASNLIHKIDDPQITFLIDLGMRSELVAAGRGKLLATSVPALPFEGAGLSSGMSAYTGAITGITLGEKVILRTVRDARPKGICGAGMLAIVEALLEKGLLDSEGRLLQPKNLPEDLARRFRGTMRGREFVLSWADRQFSKDICVNQDDIHQIQLAKGAIFAACQAMLAVLEADEADIREILLAESSEANIRPESALAIGLLPRIDPSRIISVGNAAWQGACLVLSNKDFLKEAERIATVIESLDLTSDLIYAEEFIKAMNF